MIVDRIEAVSPPGTGVDATSVRRPASRLSLQNLDLAEAPDADPAARQLADWVRTYLMQPHAEIGRTGHVCPFTARASRLALLKIGISRLGAGDRDAILQVMREALGAFDAMPCERKNRVFRTTIVGFPNCAADGIPTLLAVQNAMRHHSILQGKMIGLFEPASQAEGLINRAFRPLRAPVPAVAIRMLVEQDAPFVVRNPLLLPIYLLKFPFAGTRRLVEACSRRSKN